MELYNLAFAHELRYYSYTSSSTTIDDEHRISYPYGVISTLLQGGGIIVVTPENKVVTVIKSYPM